MKWMLLIFFINHTSGSAPVIAVFDTETGCNEALAAVLEHAPRPNFAGEGPICMPIPDAEGGSDE